MFLLRYSVEGLGPILKTFCTELATYKDKKLTGKMYQSIISEVPSGSDKSIEEILVALDRALKVVGGNVTHVTHVRILPVILNIGKYLDTYKNWPRTCTV